MAEAHPYRRQNAQSERIWSLNISDIHPDPAQARRIFEPGKLAELARSISELGVIQPLIVRNTPQGFTLIAGERRLRAAAMAGLTHVPCIISRAEGERAAYMALVENLQRRDLDCFEEAAGIARLMETYGLSREDAAAKLGKSSSALANKLRLLKLDPACISAIRRAGLTERHARALLRLPDREAVLSAVEHMGKNRLSVAQAESYVESLLAPEKEKKPVPTPAPPGEKSIFRAISKAVKNANSGGICARVDREENENTVTYKITVKKGS